jgi:protocatechuate 3,4-dioxygenase alpha subunit
VVPETTPGAVWLRGRVLDGKGDPVPDALVETWQADPDGRFDHPDDPRGSATGFRGFGRCPTDSDGGYAILTLKPGPVPDLDGGEQAPHVDVSILARGLLKRLVTRIYFSDEARANEADPALSRLDPEARATLIADRTEDGFRFDVRLHGDRETVFFDL